MKFRALFGALAAAAVLIVGMAVPASATEVARVSQADCNARHDFTEFFRNNDPADKYCYSSGGLVNSVLAINLTHVTWVHPGNNAGQIWFFENGTGELKRFDLVPGHDTGCTDCYVQYVQLYV